jgi:hypothetical protein
MFRIERAGCGAVARNRRVTRVKGAVRDDRDRFAKLINGDIPPAQGDKVAIGRPVVRRVHALQAGIRPNSMQTE